MKNILILLSAVALSLTLATAEGKCGGDKNKTEMKCAAGKCGSDAKNDMKKKCGDGQSDASKKEVPKEGKCGKGKCGQ